MKDRFKKSSSGTSSFIQDPFNGILHNIAAKVIIEDLAKEKKKTPFYSRGRVQRLCHNIDYKLPEHVVLEIRALYEFEGYTPRKLMELYAAQYNFSKLYLYALLRYATRSSLFPHKYNLPAWVTV